MSDRLDNLKSLHTALVDSRNGYEEALKDADARGLTGLFSEMMALRQQSAVEIEPLLLAAGETPKTEGSFMSTVHRTVISVRSLFGGLDESVIPGLIDGEQRILSYYDEAIAEASAPERSVLEKQRQQVAMKIAHMETLKAKAA